MNETHSLIMPFLLETLDAAGLAGCHFQVSKCKIRPGGNQTRSNPLTLVAGFCFGPTMAALGILTANVLLLTHATNSPVSFIALWAQETLKVADAYSVTLFTVYAVESCRATIALLFGRRINVAVTEEELVHGVDMRINGLLKSVTGKTGWGRQALMSFLGVRLHTFPAGRAGEAASIAERSQTANAFYVLNLGPDCC